MHAISNAKSELDVALTLADAKKEALGEVLSSLSDQRESETEGI
jgi:hypothetical protein